MEEESGKGTILLVDDTPSTIAVVKTALEEEGYEVLVATSGEKALKRAAISTPDLILLDIRMPGMDGYETCHQLKIDETTAEIPVIFMSGLAETFDKVKGFNLGAVDYVVKPIATEELLARARTHITISHLQKALEDANARLEERVLSRTEELRRANARLQEEIAERKRAQETLRRLNEELEQRVEDRTTELKNTNNALQESLETLRRAQDQLVQSEKMAALGGLVAGVAHEINTPIGVGITAASYLEDQTREMEQIYHEHHMKRSDLEHYLNTAREATGMIMADLQRAAELVQSFKQVAVDQSSEEKRRFKLKGYINNVLLSLGSKLKKTSHSVSVDCPEDFELESYPGTFSQIITNFIMNSLNHGFAPNSQGKIELHIREEQGTLRIRYSDNGKGMSTQERSRIFEPFYTTKRGQGSSGLGLHIVYNLVTRRLHGQIECQSTPGAGTTFFIQIPIEESRHPGCLQDTGCVGQGC